MIQAKCVEKHRDNTGYITEYVLVDGNGNPTVIKSNDLKQLIQSGSIQVINLTLTSDNRLIDSNKTSDNTMDINFISMLHKRIINVTYKIICGKDIDVFKSNKENELYTNQKIIDLPKENKSSYKNGFESVMTFVIPIGALMVRVNTLISNGVTHVSLFKTNISSNALVNPETQLWNTKSSTSFEVDTTLINSNNCMKLYDDIITSRHLEAIKQLNEKCYHSWLSDVPSKFESMCSKVGVQPSTVDNFGADYMKLESFSRQLEKVEDESSMYHGHNCEDIRITLLRNLKQKEDWKKAREQLNKLKSLNGDSRLRVEPGEGFTDVSIMGFTSSGVIKVTNLDTGIEQNIPNYNQVLNTLLNSNELNIVENHFICYDGTDKWLSPNGYKAAKGLNSVKNSAIELSDKAGKLVNNAIEDPRGTANKALVKTEDTTRKLVNGIKGWLKSF